MGGGLALLSEAQVHVTDHRVTFVNNTAGVPTVPLSRPRSKSLHLWAWEIDYKLSGKVMCLCASTGSFLLGTRIQSKTVIYMVVHQDVSVGSTESYTLAHACTACPVGSYCQIQHSPQ